VTEEDLEQIFELAYAHHRGPGLDPASIIAGRCYSNGEFGERWEVRRVHTVAGNRVDYRVVAGRGRRRTGHSSREAFARWGSYEVVRRENTWHRVDGERVESDVIAPDAEPSRG
jgi:CBS domain-containing membrane protein